MAVTTRNVEKKASADSQRTSPARMESLEIESVDSSCESSVSSSHETGKYKNLKKQELLHLISQLTTKNGQLKEEVKKVKKANNSLKRKSYKLQVQVALNRAKVAELNSNVKSKLTQEQANTNSVKQENTNCFFG